MKLAAIAPVLVVLVSLCGSAVPDPGGTISGLALYDANRNGIHDSCDSPLSHVAVSATASNGKTAQATAGDDGTFHIEHAPPGDDRLTLVPGEGFVWPMTTTASDGAPGLSVHVDELQDTPGVEIGSASRTAFDASQVSISGIIYDDLNANGLIDKDECGIPDANVDQVQTDPAHAAPLLSDGTYLLMNLPSPGPVSVTVNPATTGNGSGDISNWTPTTATLPDSASSCGPSVQPVQRYGPTLYEANIGFIQERNAGSVMGYIFDDANGNGVRDLEETGVAGASIFLEQVQTSCSAYSESTYPTTDAAGHFDLGGVPPGLYKIVLHDGPQATNGLVASAWDPEMTITVHGHNITSINLPVRHEQGATARITTFNDTNGNGSWDDGEQPLEGMSVCLFPPGSYGRADPNPMKQSSPQGPNRCGQTGPDGVSVVGPMLAGEYYLSLGPLSSGSPYTEIPQQHVTLTDGQALDLDIPVDVLSVYSQLIPASSGTPLTVDTCYSDPTWVQPPFEHGYAEGSATAIGNWPPEADAREMYSHGIYVSGSQQWYVWATIAGLSDWLFLPTPGGCAKGATGPVLTVDLAGYEPLSGVTAGDVEQITLSRHDTGLYVTQLDAPPYGGNQRWYLFVDEEDKPLARCSYGQCEWFN